jgi:putative transposase
MRWHAHYHTAGTGRIDQGRFQSFLVEMDEHLYTLWRYLQRNALRANLVARAEAWRWGSWWQHQRGDAEVEAPLHAWPVAMPANWVELVNVAQTEAEVEAVRQAVARGSPFGSGLWCERTARQLGLQATLRPRGRPPKKAEDGMVMPS